MLPLPLFAEAAATARHPTSSSSRASSSCPEPSASSPAAAHFPPPCSRPYQACHSARHHSQTRPPLHSSSSTPRPPAMPPEDPLLALSKALAQPISPSAPARSPPPGCHPLCLHRQPSGTTSTSISSLATYSFLRCSSMAYSIFVCLLDF